MDFFGMSADPCFFLQGSVSGKQLLFQLEGKSLPS